MRKTIDIPEDIFELLEKLAKKEARTLKNYIEHILIKVASKSLPKKESN